MAPWVYLKTPPKGEGKDSILLKKSPPKPKQPN